MNIKNKLIAAASLLALFVAPAFAFAQTVPSTTASLQAEITSLLAEVQALEAQLNGQSSSSSGFCYEFNTNFGEGGTASSADVQALQTALAKDGESVSPTGIFDDQTAAAVVAFQEKYTSSILAPYGLSNGTGYVGVTTRAELNTLFGCGKLPPPPSNPPSACPAWGCSYTPLAPATSTASSGGSLTVSENSSANIDATAGGTDQPIGFYTLVASPSEAINVNSITFYVGNAQASSFRNLHISVNGDQFGTTQSILSGGDNYTFGGSFTIPAGGSAKIDVYADVLSSVAGTVSYATELESCTGVGATASDNVTCAGAVDGQNIVISGTAQSTTDEFSAAENSGFASGSVIAGPSDAEIGSYIVENNTSEAVNVNSVTVQAGANAGLFQNLNITTSGGTQIGDTQGVLSDNNAYTFANTGNPISIPAGNSIVLDVYADGAGFNGIAGSVNTTSLTGIQATGATSGLSYGIGNSVTGQTMTVAAQESVSSVTVTSPSAGQSFTGTGTINVQWTPTNEGVEEINLDPVGNPNIGSYSTGLMQLNYSGQYTFSFPNSGIVFAPGNYYVELVGANGTIIGASGAITITSTSSATPSVSLTVNGSTGVVSAASGSNLSLGWTSTGVTSCTSEGNNWNGSVATSGSQNVTAQTTAVTTGAQYEVNCTTPSDATVQSVVQVNISPSASASSAIIITSPNGGETFTQGGNNVITWHGPTCQYASLYGCDYLELYDSTGQSFKGWIADGLPGSGSYTWDGKTVCSGSASGQQGLAGCTTIQPGSYKILVQDEQGDSEQSNAPFTIVAGASQATGGVLTGSVSAATPQGAWLGMDTAGVELAQYQFKADANGNETLTQVTITDNASMATDRSSFINYRLTDANGDVLGTGSEEATGQIGFNLSKSLSIAANTTQYVDLLADVNAYPYAQSGGTHSFALTSFQYAGITQPTNVGSNNIGNTFTVYRNTLSAMSAPFSSPSSVSGIGNTVGEFNFTAGGDSGNNPAVTGITLSTAGSLVQSGTTQVLGLYDAAAPSTLLASASLSGTGSATFTMPGSGWMLAVGETKTLLVKTYSVPAGFTSFSNGAAGSYQVNLQGIVWTDGATSAISGFGPAALLPIAGQVISGVTASTAQSSDLATISVNLQSISNEIANILKGL